MHDNIERCLVQNMNEVTFGLNVTNDKRLACWIDMLIARNFGIDGEASGATVEASNTGLRRATSNNDSVNFPAFRWRQRQRERVLTSVV